MVSWREYLARHLVGRGLDLGPGHQPFPVIKTATEVRYVDKWEPEDNAARFPELAGESFPMPDVVADLDVEGLSMLGAESEDFIVASHILEHMANPLRVIGECYRVLKPGGVLLILLPSREHLWLDSRRPGTTLAHLVAELEAGVTGVDDEHVREFLLCDPNLSDEAVRQAIERRDEAIQPLLDAHRERSIHAHCWTMDEFADVLAYCIAGGQRWEFIEGLSPGHPGEEISFGFVLRRSTTDCSPGVLADRFAESLRVWAARPDFD